MIHDTGPRHISIIPTFCHRILENVHNVNYFIIDPRVRFGLHSYLLEDRSKELSIMRWVGNKHLLLSTVFYVVVEELNEWA